MRIEKGKNAAARTLGALGASKGGTARAKKLSPAERREQARAAALSRWSEGLARATHGSADRPLKIGDIEIPCYVLADGRRVLAQRGLQAGVGWSRSSGKGGARRLVRFLLQVEGKGFDIKDLLARADSPIKFITPRGTLADGYEASILPDICDVMLEARKKGALTGQQEHLAERCEILVRGFARVGIVALVDEATGYQSDRSRDALAKILERFIATEIRKWVKTFPPQFYSEMYRLRGWHYASDSRAHPQIVGNYTNDIVYKRLAPGVLEELRRLTPRNDKGRLKTHLHRRLTEDVGNPRLREHLASVVTIMKLSKDWSDFNNKLDRVHPRWGDTLMLPLPDPEETNVPSSSGA